MPKIWLGATGRLSTGHVLDVNKAPLERMLQDYDPQLYVKWNPRKLKGWGCWEVRRRPEEKQVVNSIEFEGNTYSKIDYYEIDIVNHIIDQAFLNYDVLTRLKAIDSWNGNRNYWADQLESAEAEYREEVKQKARAEMRYMAKQQRREIKELKEMLLSGLNPAEIAGAMGKVGL